MSTCRNDGVFCSTIHNEASGSFKSSFPGLVTAGSELTSDNSDILDPEIARDKVWS